MDPEQEDEDRAGHQPARVPERLRYQGMGAAYQGAMEAVLSIVVAILIGWWVDSSWETGPWGVLAGATIGFGAFVVRLTRLRSALDLPAEDAESPPGRAEEAPRAAGAGDASPGEHQDGER